MLIAEFCARTGLSRDTVRFYEKLKLLQPRVGPSGTNRYRVFDAALVERAEGIRHAKAMGFSLEEIRRLIQAHDGGRLDRTAQLAYLRQKVGEVDARIVAARAMRRYLCEKIDRLQRGAPPVDATSVSRTKARPGRRSRAGS